MTLSLSKPVKSDASNATTGMADGGTSTLVLSFDGGSLRPRGLSDCRGADEEQQGLKESVSLSPLIANIEPSFPLAPRDNKATGPTSSPAESTRRRDLDPEWSCRTSGEVEQEGGRVVAASINALIGFLTSPDNIAEDDELMVTLVLMHRVTSSHQAFLGKLVSRFRAAVGPLRFGVEHRYESEAELESELVVMRHKVCSIVLVWLRDFFRDFSDAALAASLTSFLGMTSSSTDRQSPPNGLPRLQLGLEQEPQLDWSSLMLVKDVMRRVLEDRLSLLQIHEAYIAEGRSGDASRIEHNYR